MLRNMLTDSVSGFADFEKGMAKVSTMLDAHTMSYLPRYSNEIKKMSVQYGEAAEHLTTGLYDILSAQIDAADATKVLDQSLRSARGGFTSAAITTQAIVQTLKAYGKEADYASRVSDIMHATVKQGRFTLEDYASTIGDIIGLAAYLNIDLEAVGASIATMTKSGLSAGKAVTALKNILNQFIYPTQAARDAATELGFSLDENSIKGSGLIKIMEGLRNANAKQLDTLMPSIRGLVGFASQLKNASEVARDYEKIVNSQGLAQKNFQTAMATTATEIDIARENWNEFKRDLGEKIAPGATALLVEISSGFEKTRETLDDLSIVWDKWIEERYKKASNAGKYYGIGGFGGGIIGAPPSMPLTGETLPIGRLEIPPRRQQYLEEMRQRARLIDEAINYKGALPGTEYRIEQAEKITDVEKVVNADVLADTREYLLSVRSMHDKTRMEKIRMLEDYRAKHAEIMYDAVGAETAAGEAIRKEIEYIRESRKGGLDIYRAELQEDMENTSLYISDKFAETGRSIEGSMSGAFQAMISDGASFRDAMVQFFNDIGRAFSRMAADMIARSVMESWLAPLLGGMAGMFSGGLGGSAAAPTYVPHHEGWIPEYHGGRRIMPNEHLALIENDEWVVPGSKVTRGGSAAAPSIVIYNESGQAIEKKGEPQFDGESWVVSLIARNYTQGGSLKKLIR